MLSNNSQEKWSTEDGVCIGHLNINCAINKISELETVLYKSGTPTHIFGVSEALVTEIVLDSNIYVSGYTLEWHQQCK